jgi:hypothetical protein
MQLQSPAALHTTASADCWPAPRTALVRTGTSYEAAASLHKTSRPGTLTSLQEVVCTQNITWQLPMLHLGPPALAFTSFAHMCADNLLPACLYFRLLLLLQDMGFSLFD